MPTIDPRPDAPETQDPIGERCAADSIAEHVRKIRLLADDLPDGGTLGLALALGSVDDELELILAGLR